MIIIGDHKFPDLARSARIIITRSAHARVHSEFLDKVDDIAQTQMVEEETRENKTLDFISTTHIHSALSYKRPSKDIRPRRSFEQLQPQLKAK